MKFKYLALAAVGFALGYGLVSCNVYDFLSGVSAGAAAVCAWAIYMEDEEDVDNDSETT